MFCPKCGAQNPDGAMFCASCGNKFAAPVTQAPAPQMQQNFAQPQMQPGQQANRAFYATPQRGFATMGASAALSPVFDYGSIAAAILGIVAFFLPVLTVSVTASVLGFGSGSLNVNPSCFQMFTGFDVSGFGATETVPGEFFNLMYVIPFIFALVFSFVLKGKARWIAQTACAAASLAISVYAYSYFQQIIAAFESDLGVASASASSSLGIGFHLMVIAGVLLLVLALFSLNKAKQQR